MNSIEQSIQFFKSVLTNVNPREFLPNIVQWDQNERLLTIYDQSFPVHRSQNIYVLGTGKASPTMAIAIEEILGSDLRKGFIIAPPDTKLQPNTIQMMEGSHPLPDESSRVATDKLISLIEQIPDGSVVLNLLSGGTSALLCKPADGLSIQDFQKTYKLLLESGANIHEVNSVRKAVSAVKGGRLLSYFKDITLLDLVISDVPNDELTSIGSGPTTPQEISCQKAYSVLNQYKIWDRLPATVRSYLSDQLAQETNHHTQDLSNHHSWIVSSASIVAKKFQKMLQEEGYNTTLFEPAWSGPIHELEDHIMEKLQTSIKDSKDTKKALLFFGESTVTVTGNGLGGRNQELALRIAIRLKHFDSSVLFLSAGTDGIDGPTDVAGAVVHQHTFEVAKNMGIDPVEYLDKNDSYHFFKKAGGQIKTGPTGNNVMDLQILLMDQ